MSKNAEKDGKVYTLSANEYYQFTNDNEIEKVCIFSMSIELNRRFVQTFLHRKRPKRVEEEVG